MTNVGIALLNELIERSGYKKSYIAEQLGLTPQGLSNKLAGRTDFGVGEAKKLSKLLNLKPTQIRTIFL